MINTKYKTNNFVKCKFEPIPIYWDYFIIASRIYPLQILLWIKIVLYWNFNRNILTGLCLRIFLLNEHNFVIAKGQTINIDLANIQNENITSVTKSLLYSNKYGTAHYELSQRHQGFIHSKIETRLKLRQLYSIL